jgi:hypothetical protein
VTDDWMSAFPGQRPPFEEGNTLAVRHGAYAIVLLGPRVDELAAELRELVPAYSLSDEPAVRVLGLAFARLERAEAALETAAPSELGKLRQDALGWANAARRLLNDLGMTPTARARLGLDIVRTREEAFRRLDAHLAAKHGAPEDGGS